MVSVSKRNVILKIVLITLCIRTFYEILNVVEREIATCLVMALKIILCVNVAL